MRPGYPAYRPPVAPIELAARLAADVVAARFPRAPRDLGARSRRTPLAALSAPATGLSLGTNAISTQLATGGGRTADPRRSNDVCPAVESFAGVGRFSAVYRGHDGATDRATGLASCAGHAYAEPAHDHRAGCCGRPDQRGREPVFRVFADAGRRGAHHVRGAVDAARRADVARGGDAREHPRARERGLAPRTLARAVDLLTPVADVRSGTRIRVGSRTGACRRGTCS